MRKSIILIFIIWNNAFSAEMAYRAIRFEESGFPVEINGALVLSKKQLSGLSLCIVSRSEILYDALDYKLTNDSGELVMLNFKLNVATIPRADIDVYNKKNLWHLSQISGKQRHIDVNSVFIPILTLGGDFKIGISLGAVEKDPNVIKFMADK